MILLIPIALLILVMIGCLIAAAHRRCQLRAELRGDWWPGFERDLREYMSHTWSSAREAERRLQAVAARLLRGGWGALLVVAPHRLLELGGIDTPPVRGAVRVLGARHVAETLILGRAHDDRPRRWIAMVDALHGASMLMLAAVSPRMRRDALASAASTGVLMALALAERQAAAAARAAGLRRANVT